MSRWVKGLAAMCLLASSCALFSKGEVPVRRYYDPVAEAPDAAAPGGAAPAQNVELRLGRVSAGESIDQRVMFRDSPHELGFYEDRAWTERPEVYLRRELTRALYQDRGLRSSERTGGPTLEVELVSFEEVKAPAHVGRVRVALQLSDPRGMSLQQTVSVDRPVQEARPEKQGGAVAQALGEALRAAVDEVAGRVLGDLEHQQTATLTPCPAGTAQGTR
jgi:cholesterol transport system auxiliary component